MLADQITLFQYATEVLGSCADLEPIPFPTPMVAKRLGLSSSTLNRAKKNGQLPYRCNCEGMEVIVDFSHYERGKDYWTVVKNKSKRR